MFIEIGFVIKLFQTLERFNVASNRLSGEGVGMITRAVKNHPKLVLLDLGFTRATTVLGELGNIMGDEGNTIGDLLI